MYTHQWTSSGWSWSSISITILPNPSTIKCPRKGINIINIVSLSGSPLIGSSMQYTVRGELYDAIIIRAWGVKVEEYFTGDLRGEGEFCDKVRSDVVRSSSTSGGNICSVCVCVCVHNKMEITAAVCMCMQQVLKCFILQQLLVYLSSQRGTKINRKWWQDDRRSAAVDIYSHTYS